jgi:hypothetical protein
MAREASLCILNALLGGFDVRVGLLWQVFEIRELACSSAYPKVAPSREAALCDCKISHRALNVRHVFSYTRPEQRLYLNWMRSFDYVGLIL